MLGTRTIVLFKNGTFQIFRTPVNRIRNQFQPGARFFECKEETLIDDICEWIARFYENTNFIKELKED